MSNLSLNFMLSGFRTLLTLNIHVLATGPGDIRSRLVNAHLIFFSLKTENFPVELQSDWKWVIKELTKFGPVLDHSGNPRIGSVQNTCNRIKRKTGVRIAEKIYDIYQYLDSH